MTVRTSTRARTQAFGWKPDGELSIFWVRRYDDGQWRSLDTDRHLRECYPVVLASGEFIRGTGFNTVTDLLRISEHLAYSRFPGTTYYPPRFKT